MMGELDMYTAERQQELGENPEGRTLENDMQMLSDFSRMNNNVDFAGRIVWAEQKDKNGHPILDAQGNPQMIEVFNFGKHKGIPVAEVLRFDPGYYSWILGGDFTYNTKQVLTRIRLREAQKI
jgi:DNA polymerase-3 subunit epsilon